MKTLRRYNAPHTNYFITCVAFQRRRVLLNDTNLFWDSWGDTRPYAWVILPDHFHIVVNSGTEGISDYMHLFKTNYSRLFRRRFGPGRIWQNRFWDHLIRNETDLNRHLDYIHYNPVKHMLTGNPFEYEHSSLRIFYEQGLYQRDWGVMKDIALDGDYGE